MIVIGITGRARSGKGVVAEAIADACVDRYDCKTYEISDFVLSDLKAKKMISQTAERKNLTKEQLDLMVAHGLHLRGTFKDYWMQTLYNKIMFENPQVALVPSIRFLNEAELIHFWFNGPVIRVKRFVEDGVDFVSMDRDPNSPMETENLKIKADYVLSAGPNQVPLLKQQAKTLFEYILNEEKIKRTT